MQESILSIQPPDPPFWSKTSWLQLGYGVWVNLNVIGIGLCFGFAAVSIPQMREGESRIHISSRDEAWIVSILTLSSPIGSMLCGLLMDRYGRRLVLVLCELPLCFGWFYTGFATTARDIIIGRVIAGVGLGMAIIAPRAYITEITLPNMRGLIGALPNLFISVGLTIQAALGSFLTWHILCYICGTFSLIMMISNIFLPETPYFLLMKSSSTHRLSLAEVNLKRFRSARFNVAAELAALYDFRTENNCRRLSLKDQIQALIKPSACKPFGITTMYIIFMQLAGVNVVIMWTVEMLEASYSSINANLGNFYLGLTRIVSGILTSVLLYKVGRRVIAMVSAIGVGVAAIGLCLFLYTVHEKSILPLFIFMAYISFATLGYYTLPFLMMFELLPLQIRGLLSGICIAQLNIMMFAMNNCYPWMRQKLGLPNTMAMFGGFSLLGALILYFILPETKGLTLQEIEEFFNSRRPTLVSQRHVMSEQLKDSRMNFGPSKSNQKEKIIRERDKSKTSFYAAQKLEESGLKINSLESGQDVKKNDSRMTDKSKDLTFKKISVKQHDKSIKDKEKNENNSKDEEKVLEDNSKKNVDDFKAERKDSLDNKSDSKDAASSFNNDPTFLKKEDSEEFKNKEKDEVPEEDLMQNDETDSVNEKLPKVKKD